ncbi:MAG: hypothetical protein JO061_18180 [Acidobacteriaceae bacterium]|nr:hypothetical protein [Acidobacteriaceae bacterium]
MKPMLVKWISVFPALTGAITASAHEKPTTPCSLQEPSTGVAEVITADQSVQCYQNGKCSSLPIHPGDAVLVYRTENGWTCGYVSRWGVGAGPAWLPDGDLRAVQVDANPSLSAWLGTWTNGEDQIKITQSTTAGELDVSGSAEWHGRPGVVHTGAFKGHAEPSGNRLHVAEGTESYSCSVDLTLLGKFLQTSDNMNCGGANVRFGGLWRRASEEPAQNGPGNKRAPQRAAGSFPCLGARIRALCASE